MQLGMIGLGRMGANMARRLRRGGIDVVAYNRDPVVARALAEETGLRAADSLPALVEVLPPPRILWLMLPAGEVTARHIDQLAQTLAPGDLIIDGANANYKDSVRRAAELAARDIAFVDAGVSGGIWGLENGYALMLGGDANAIERLAPALRVLAPAADRGWLHCGPAGSGHFVKMIHNGIEYGMMQAYAEGFALLDAREDFALDLAAIAETWRHGSVVRSWLLDLTAGFLADDATLADVKPHAADSGEGRWTVIESIEQGIPAPVIASAVTARFMSQGGGDFGNRMLAMMRKAFGGHAVKKAD
jgi:6-phosphogluconate dehydrogenase